MRSGTKNCPVTIYRNVEIGKDPQYNTPIFQPAIWKEPFCNIMWRRSSEVDITGQVRASIVMRLDFEYFDVEGISTQDWIEYEGVAYSIIGLGPDLNLKETYTVDVQTRPEADGRT